eukprot:714220-Amphidinium_carterae.1
MNDSFKWGVCEHSASSRSLRCLHGQLKEVKLSQRLQRVPRIPYAKSDRDLMKQWWSWPPQALARHGRKSEQLHNAAYKYLKAVIAIAERVRKTTKSLGDLETPSEQYIPDCKPAANKQHC